MEQNYWKKCGSCKKEIGFNTIYQTCNVSTCKKLIFCSVDCWNLHNPVMNHKNSWACENISPKRILLPSLVHEKQEQSGNEKEILIVVSKLKQYIKEKFDMNTSANVMDLLSDKIRQLVREAHENARKDGRKTIMDRDFD